MSDETVSEVVGETRAEPVVEVNAASKLLSEAAAVKVEPAVENKPKAMTSIRGMNIQLLEDAAVLELPNGILKTISLQDFVTLVNSSFGRVAEEAGNEVLLPRNCFYFSTTPKSIKLSLYYPEAVQTLQFQSGGPVKYYKVATPNIVICLDLIIRGSKATVSASKYFCTDRPLATFTVRHNTAVDRTVGLYLLPFSNIYDDGKLCTGDNVMPAEMDRKDLRKANWYHDVLFNSPFNNDLGLHAVAGWDMGVEAWYRYLQEEAAAGRKFPYEKLRGYSPVR
jgi:hypothetical protein